MGQPKDLALSSEQPCFLTQPWPCNEQGDANPQTACDTFCVQQVRPRPGTLWISHSIPKSQSTETRVGDGRGPRSLCAAWSRTGIDGRRAGLVGDLALSCRAKARAVLILPSSCPISPQGWPCLGSSQRAEHGTNFPQRRNEVQREGQQTSGPGESSASLLLVLSLQTNPAASAQPQGSPPGQDHSWLPPSPAPQPCPHLSSRCGPPRRPRQRCR